MLRKLKSIFYGILLCFFAFNAMSIEINDTFFSASDCKKAKKGYTKCEFDIFEFYGKFENGYQNGIGLYKLNYEDPVYFVAEHKNGLVHGIGKTVLVFDDSWTWVREIYNEFFESHQFDYPNSLMSELTTSSSGLLYDTLYNYSIIGSFNHQSTFFPEKKYLINYQNTKHENKSYLDGKLYYSKIDFDSLRKEMILPKDGLGMIFMPEHQPGKNARFIGNIKNGRPHGTGFVELDFVQRPINQIEVPPLDYFENLDDQNKFLSGSFEEGKLTKNDQEFLKDAETFLELESDFFTTQYYFNVENLVIDFNSKYSYILNDIEGFINSIQ